MLEAPNKVRCSKSHVVVSIWKWYVYRASVSSAHFEQAQARNPRQPCSLPAARTRPLRPRDHFSSHTPLNAYLSIARPGSVANDLKVETRNKYANPGPLYFAISLRKIAGGPYRASPVGRCLVHMHCEQCIEDLVDCSWSSWSADAALFRMCSSGPPHAGPYCTLVLTQRKSHKES
jgi:hypothetical protein